MLKEQEKIKLWTIHTENFLVTDGYVDHTKSIYYQETNGVKDAYHRLWEVLSIPNGQIIWCDTDDSENILTIERRIKWEFEVPLSDVICFLDDLVWNRILGIKCCLPRNMQSKFRKKAMVKFPNDSEASKSYERQYVDEFWDRKPTGKSWWDELFVDSPGVCISALIKHPIKSQCIRKKTPHWL